MPPPCAAVLASITAIAAGSVRAIASRSAGSSSRCLQVSLKLAPAAFEESAAVYRRSVLNGGSAYTRSTQSSFRPLSTGRLSAVQMVRFSKFALGFSAVAMLFSTVGRDCLAAGRSGTAVRASPRGEARLSRAGTSCRVGCRRCIPVGVRACPLA